MNGPVVVRLARAPSLIPCLTETVKSAVNPLILVPESFTLTTEQALIRASDRQGFIGTQVLSQTSLVREIRERAGFPERGRITADGRNMILSLLLLRNRDKLLFYKENANQVHMAERLAAQIDDLADGGFSPDLLEDAAGSLKKSTVYKCHDIALLWREYERILDSGYADRNASWYIALDRLEQSGLLQGTDLLIFGFDSLTLNLTELIAAAYPLVRSLTVGLIGSEGTPDREIFELAIHSIEKFEERMQARKIPVRKKSFEAEITVADPGLRYLERNLYAIGRREAEVPDLSHVRAYYAANTSVECLHTAQALIAWHRAGIPWHEMAVAVCDDTTLPALLPLVFSAAGIPYASRGGIPMLLSEYAQYFVAVLRALRTNYKQEEMLKVLSSRFSALSDAERMDLENFVRARGIDRYKWTRPFPGAEQSPAEQEGETPAENLPPAGEEARRMEALRVRLMEPLTALRKTLSARACTGRKAAEAIFGYMLSVGAYDTLLARERELIDAGMLAAADRNRQVWSAVNELLDQLAVFAAGDHLSLEELCAMLESSVSAKMIQSLPQVADSVLVSSPNMFFSSGLRAVAVVGLQDRATAVSAALLTPAECAGLVREDDRGRKTAGIGITRREAAARARQDVYQAVAAAAEEILFSCSAAQPNGRVLSAAQVFRDVEQLLKDHRPGNLTGGLTRDGLLPFVPAFALERLAVMLRAARDGSVSFLNGDDAESRLWRQTLAWLWQQEAWHAPLAAVLEGLHVKIASPGIPPALAVELYSRDRLSVSAIETAAACLFQAFLTYALRVHQRRDFAFEADAEGTFSHEVLKQFFSAAMNLPSWPALTENEISALLDRILAEETKPWEDGPLGRNTAGRFRGQEILHTVRTAVSTLARALRADPHFRPIGMEIAFGRMSSDAGLHFPAVRLPLGENQEIALSGKIDRVDTVRLSDGRKAVLVYDFKSSDKDVHGDALAAGLQLQLPLYLLAARQALPDHVPAGALYQPVKEVLVDAADGDRAAIEDGIAKALRARGIFLDDKEIQQASAPLKIPARASATDLLSVVTPEGLEEVIDKGVESACTVVRRMFAGETTPNPLQDGMRSPCEYCGMRDACPLDSRLEGGRVRKLKSIEKNDDPGEEE